MCPSPQNPLISGFFSFKGSEYGHDLRSICNRSEPFETASIDRQLIDFNFAFSLSSVIAGLGALNGWKVARFARIEWLVPGSSGSITTLPHFYSSFTLYLSALLTCWKCLSPPLSGCCCKHILPNELSADDGLPDRISPRSFPVINPAFRVPGLGGAIVPPAGFMRSLHNGSRNIVWLTCVGGQSTGFPGVCHNCSQALQILSALHRLIFSSLFTA